MDNKVVVYGAGGHGKVVAEILAASGRTLDGFIDDNAALAGTSVIGVPVFAAVQWLRLHPGATILLGIGDNCARERAASLVKRHGCKLAIAVHPSATVARSAKLAQATVIMPAAVLNPDCEIGEGAIINSGAIVEHDVRIDRYAHLSPNCAVAGGAQIGAYSHIGIGASVLPLKRVGANCIVGAGAVVIDDIADNQVVFGVPAKVVHCK
jgi:sugar O-acyltransferase (sialic acid O-acetyltransferase NeuD family)